MAASAIFCHLPLSTSFNPGSESISLDWAVYRSTASGILTLPYGNTICSMHLSLSVNSPLAYDLVLGQDWLFFCRETLPGASFQFTLALFQVLSHSALHLFLNPTLIASLSNHLLHDHPLGTPDHWDNMSQDSHGESGALSRLSDSPVPYISGIWPSYDFSIQVSDRTLASGPLTSTPGSSTMAMSSGSAMSVSGPSTSASGHDLMQMAPLHLLHEIFFGTSCTTYTHIRIS
ncbi:hypothetical protein DFH08DRAFT_312224 [Mycena albidolilacea]|uniref:Uncharacterized protein n=1 Tax=Mycena albidolilacea TaxID=1033008 RepID=A0AAD6ZMZ5_9AGAR|nr:hypothetical protein DFH08DRAFT_312224 [Mycena albidolilacea]